MPAQEDIERLYERLKAAAEASGYRLNPDMEFTMSLVESLLINEERYGYEACPCRLASGVKQEDLDIICPCDYRDPDLSEHGSCYCALYVAEEIAAGEAEPQPIPERRPPDPTLRARARDTAAVDEEGLAVWRCRVCGYLCAREHPPEVCPICKAKRERFERFALR